MPAPNFSVARYATMLLNLLPRGIIWQRDPASVQGQVMTGLAHTYTDLTDRAAYLPVDTFPSTTAELLPEWETTLGLPDQCLGELPTIQQRVDAVAAKFIADGGASISYFTSVAAQLGLTISIQEFRATTVGAHAGDYVSGDDWAHHWMVTVYGSRLSYVTRADASYAGDYIETFQQSGIECVLNRIKPAHTTLGFTYTDGALLTESGIPLSAENGQILYA